ncbi:hypothetical protein ACNQVK_00625 [Mycobacterium sp. 134]|uniref:hypothetical protein n=1 Tax=Mycobacterium sp. 134 TaxID=3400425 RepID=UPI003AAD6529
MSQADENYSTATPTPPQPSKPPLLQPALNPPPGYIPKRGAGLCPYPTQPSQPTVQVAKYSGAAPVKNPGAAAVLAALFGPLGMVYATFRGALVVFGVNTLLLFVGFFTEGWAWLAWPLAWILGIVWAYKAARQSNAKLLLPPRVAP